MRSDKQASTGSPTGESPRPSDLPLKPGDIAVDRDSDDNSPGVIVVNIPTDETGTCIPAGEYVVFEEPDGTVWTIVPDYNDPAEFGPEQPVVEGVYAASLTATLDGPWSPEGVLLLSENDAFERSPAEGGIDVKVWAFPVGRLHPRV